MLSGIDGRFSLTECARQSKGLRRGLSKHGVGVEPLFLGFLGTAVFRGLECRIGRW